MSNTPINRPSNWFWVINHPDMTEAQRAEWRQYGLDCDETKETNSTTGINNNDGGNNEHT